MVKSLDPVFLRLPVNNAKFNLQRTLIKIMLYYIGLLQATHLNKHLTAGIEEG